MPVPFESLIPFAIISGMFLVTGTGIRYAQTKRNEGKVARYSLDDWDRKMLQRDKQLTGTERGQIDEPVAPAEFKVNSAWKVYDSLRNDFA
ncbi:hypothetical protein GGI13_007764 [Coemansia sp. RSA 455]|nr:hypothetical protein GGI14_000435 [Coemansia sp. S680]KAJ2024494.1 hypothetical protein H4S03_009102 [Coemansia sp. S3946]KAJ2042344.1 hypothetical protein H4S04_007347 [Coemansia sp. S16]KAJ2055952.1 hypothetical protein GGI08_003986 [Coemansia sp. S2]KAJ2060782.1 hypothetical protein GGI17_003492 [Coemansia sp. S146]KAJ2072495.1 hypothetical protein GGH13_002651 [Coemansia sp. S155-1]KAJ2094768.1 hypothetical protein GGI09_005228 [Coemansia sp. S100]KAJ2106997.1 hypothetical protein GGI